jgi:hypothetical protein
MRLIHQMSEELYDYRTIGPAITLGLCQKLIGKPIEGDLAIEDEFRLVQEVQKCSAAELWRLDAMIIEDSETSGWRMAMSRLVQWRMSQWDAERFEQFGIALARWKRVLNGEEKPIVDDPRWYSFRQDTLKELRASGRLIADKLKTRNSSCGRRELAQMWKSVLDAHPEYGLLRQHQQNWLGFVGDPNVPCNQLTTLLQEGEFSAPQLFNEWWGHRLDRDPSSLGELFSRLGSSR